jgi:hypothetical protein
MTPVVAVLLLGFLAIIGWAGFTFYQDAYEAELHRREAAVEAAAKERIRVNQFIRSLGILETAQLDADALNASVSMLTEAIRAASVAPSPTTSDAHVVKETLTSSASTNRAHASIDPLSRRSD